MRAEVPLRSQALYPICVSGKRGRGEAGDGGEGGNGGGRVV